jgi:hypothetical protein
MAVNVWEGVIDCFKIVYADAEKVWWKFALFIYLFYSIGSSVTLSPSDIKGAFRGFIYFVVLLLLFNIATIWNGDITTRFFEKTSNQISGFYFLIILSMAMNLVFIAVLWLLGLIIGMFSGKSASPKPKK